MIIISDVGTGYTDVPTILSPQDLDDAQALLKTAGVPTDSYDDFPMFDEYPAA